MYLRRTRQFVLNLSVKLNLFLPHSCWDKFPKEHAALRARRYHGDVIPTVVLLPWKVRAPGQRGESFVKQASGSYIKVYCNLA